MVGPWDVVFMLYTAVAGMVFIGCYPFGVTILNPKDRFVQCFMALLSAVLWPIPVVMFATAVGYVLLLFLMSLVVERR
jgi:hypothetical protein